MLGVGLAIPLIAFSQDDPISFEALKTHHAALTAYRIDHPRLTALLYFILYVAVTGLSAPGVIVLSMAGGALFGLVWGTLLASFGFALGGVVAFLLARRFLRDRVRRCWGARLAAIEAGMARDGPLYLFGLRLVPVIPYFLVNLLMALTPISTRTFYWVSQLGMLPLLIVYVNAGVQAAQLGAARDLFSPALWASLGLLAIFPLLARKVIGLVGRYRTGTTSEKRSQAAHPSDKPASESERPTAKTP